MRKSKTKPVIKSVKKFMKSSRKVSPVKSKLNVQTASFKELDEEFRKLDAERSKVFHKGQDAKEKNRKAQNEAFDKLWDKVETEHMTEEEWDTAWHNTENANRDEYYQKFLAIEKEYENKGEVYRVQIKPIENAILERFVKPELTASRKDVERKEAIPHTEFRNMIEGGSWGITLELRPDQNLVTDLDDAQIQSLQDQVDLGNIMESFIYDHGFTKREEDKYGRYLDWSYPEQYETIGGQGIDPEMDFWMQMNYATWDIERERAKKKVKGAVGELLEVALELDENDK